MRAAILLAAGRSRRFGNADKLRATLWGEPLVARAARAAGAAPAQRVIVTVPRRGPLAKMFDPRRATIVRVAHPERGLSESLRAALAALRPRERELFLFLGDMPLVAHALAARLARAKAARPVWRGRPGHPVRMARPPAATVAELSGDAGLRALIGRRAKTVRGTQGEALDVDSRAALIRLRLRPGRRPV